MIARILTGRHDGRVVGATPVLRRTVEIEGADLLAE
jgi:hypothetical protein